MTLCSFCIYILIFKSILWLALVHHVTFSSTPALGAYQCITKQRNRFNTSIVWYNNIISINEITVFNCKFKVKPTNVATIFLSGKILATAASCQCFTVNLTDFYSAHTEVVQLFSDYVCKLWRSGWALTVEIALGMNKNTALSCSSAAVVYQALVSFFWGCPPWSGLAGLSAVRTGAASRLIYDGIVSKVSDRTSCLSTCRTPEFFMILF